MAYVTPTTRASGYKVPASVWNSDVVENVKMLAQGPRMTRTNSAVQAIPTGAWTPVNFNTLVNVSTFLAPVYSTSDDEWNFATPGRYQVYASVVWVNSTNSTAGAFRLLEIATSTGAGAGAPVAVTGSFPANSTTRSPWVTVSGEVIISTTANKMVIKAFQDSGANLNLAANSTDVPFRCSVRWVGKV